MWVNNKLEKISTTRVDLSGYALTETVNQQIAGVNTAIQDHIATAEATYAKKTDIKALEKISVDESGNMTINAASVTVTGGQSESGMNSIIDDIWA